MQQEKEFFYHQDTKTPRHQEVHLKVLLLFLVPWCLGGELFLN
jgi:hypothetical protein